MHFDALMWLFLPLFVAAGSAFLAYSIMKARLEVAVTRERERLAVANAAINTCKITLEERLRATESETRAKAFNEFLQDVRVEERHYIRENKSATLRKKTMVIQERVYFRTFALSGWFEHELVVEESTPEIESSVSEISFLKRPSLLQSAEVV